MIHLFVAPPWLVFGLIVAGAAVAEWRGGWAEKAVARAHLASVLLTRTLCSVVVCFGPEGPRPAWRPVVLDVAVLAVCLVVARRAKRYWVLVASSFAVLNVVTTLMGWAGLGVSWWAWTSADIIWHYALALTVLVGAWTAPQWRAGLSAA